MADWREYYKLPIVPEYEYAYFPDSEGTQVLSFDTWASTEPGFLEWFIDKINGVPNDLFDGRFTFKVIGTSIYCKEDETEWFIGNVRGWGFLTGSGGFDLAEVSAAEVQDAFADYIIKQLNKQTEGMCTIQDVVKELNSGKVVYDTKDRVFIYKQVPTVVPREIVPKMTSLPEEMKDIVKMYSGTIDFNVPQYNKYNPENGLTDTWCPTCAWIGNNRYILASEFLNKQ